MLALFLTTLVHAQTPGFDANKVTAIAYGSTLWNKDSAKIDTAFLVIRDKATGRMVTIQLEETEPDSSTFAGEFSVNLGDAGKTTPEIFIPPQDATDTKKLFALIAGGKLPRKPVIWKTDEKGRAMLDVYDTRDQAKAALDAFNEERRAKFDAKNAAVARQALAEKTIAEAKEAEHQAKLAKIAADAAKHESDRVRLEQIERQKAAERLAESKRLTEQARQERKAAADKLELEALRLYADGRYPEAETKFKESVQLDPENVDNYFKYGVTLYRNQKFNDALVILKLAQVEPKLDSERRYFMALTHYRLNELENALAEFSTVAKSGDSDLGPSAEFYRGVIFFSQDRLEESKKAFELVIDTSKDPKLDDQAEQYLERLVAAFNYRKMREKKFTFTGIVGAAYDSNVLLSADALIDQGTATEIDDFRLLTVGELEYRPILKEKHELFAKVSANMTNSVKDEAAPADPWLFTAALPYSYKQGTLKATLKPGYETLVMDPDSSGSKSAILNSVFLGADTTFVMSAKWYSSYGLEYRVDDATTADSIGPDNLDASKVTLRTTQTMFLDKARKEAILAGLGYVVNDADGRNKTYDRIEGSVNYVRPIRWGSSFIGGLQLYKLKYDDAVEKRDDFNTTLLIGMSKPVREWVTWGLMGTYTKNDSNLEVNEYSRWQIMTTATFVTNF